MNGDIWMVNRAPLYSKSWFGWRQHLLYLWIPLKFIPHSRKKRQEYGCANISWMGIGC